MTWDVKTMTEARQWYAETHLATVWTGVPVTMPSWRGWDADVTERCETVAVVDGTATVRAFDEEEFAAAAASPQPLRPLLLWGYADRPAFGHLATRKAYLERSWQPAGPVEPVAVVAPGGSRSNVAPVFSSADFTIVEVPGDDPVKPGRDPWTTPRSVEDKLLNALWDRRQRKGWWLAEVPVGFPGGDRNDRRARRIDAVVVRGPDNRHSAEGEHLSAFADAVAAGACVELIEAKRVLNAAVTGQLLSGAELFRDSYDGASMVTRTACVLRHTDGAMRWFCEEHDIGVELPHPGGSVPVEGDR